ncbi:MAG: carboxylating nicotinate-nucleotide diphosphorylase [Planctomycetes bacterium]|nr:carboxylating nicotinate-nucleotide diphosphorylase [Planctomycetota bacterium]MBI3843100.1 carboxylating nicotinate-nucleotide diphosphorylase [Planctomycetota bacterium]
MDPGFDVERARTLVALALEEDLGAGDVTAEAFLSPDAFATAVVEVKSPGVVAGLPVATMVFQAVDARLAVESKIEDGTTVETGDTLLTVRGPARGIVSAERTALNFVQRLSGIATFTRRFVDRVRETKSHAEVFDTRKTTPGYRSLEKYAVRMGGGRNHRLGLYDQILIKENHFAAAAAAQELSRPRTIRQALAARAPGVTVIVEVRDAAELKDALETEVDVIMLDNFSVDAIKKAVAVRAAMPATSRRPLFEVSGGVNLENLASIAATGVERISIGALTHSAPALDVALYVR